MAIEKIKILGAVLELPAKQHCQFLPIQTVGRDSKETPDVDCSFFDLITDYHRSSLMLHKKSRERQKNKLYR